MNPGLRTSASGMTAQQLMVDTIANNLANVNTTGFKRSRVPAGHSTSPGRLTKNGANAVVHRFATL